MFSNERIEGPNNKKKVFIHKTIFRLFYSHILPSLILLYKLVSYKIIVLFCFQNFASFTIWHLEAIILFALSLRRHCISPMFSNGTAQHYTRCTWYRFS